MAPSEHLTWFEDNIEWFEALPLAELERDVPSCPGWRLHDVLNHLAFGLGLAYPIAMAKPPDTEADQAFADVDWPTQRPDPQGSAQTFSQFMRGCAQQFRRTDPATPCWTYAGPGTAGFWFRRAAIETTLHRMDVAEALGQSGPQVDDERATDAIIETLEFALPYAADTVGIPSGQLVVEGQFLAEPVRTGRGARVATLQGAPDHVLAALWGRNRYRISIAGDEQVANQWLDLVETAFAGRG